MSGLEDQALDLDCAKAVGVLEPQIQVTLLDLSSDLAENVGDVNRSGPECPFIVGPLPLKPGRPDRPGNEESFSSSLGKFHFDATLSLSIFAPIARSSPICHLSVS